jgi:hypothetical protein
MCFPHFRGEERTEDRRPSELVVGEFHRGLIGGLDRLEGEALRIVLVDIDEDR